MQIVFIADFFLSDILGGGEIHNEVLINLLRAEGHEVDKQVSHRITSEYLLHNKDKNYIVANFLHLPEEHKEIIKSYKYIIYEHDHKYLKNRDPAAFNNFKAPKDEIINLEFYKNARAVLCQSDFHATIVSGNLGFENIFSVGGNLWSEASLNLMEELSTQSKKDRYGIIGSATPHKGTTRAIKYCEHNNLEYDIINFQPYHDFLIELSKNKNFVFFPQTPETLSRVVVEARMMNMRVITNKMVGATKESWYNLKGVNLINKMRDKHVEIVKLVESKLT